MKNQNRLQLHLLAVLFIVWDPCAGFAGQEQKIQTLMSLPYLQGYVAAPAETGVTRYDRRLAHKGYNLYASGHQPAAFLIDMQGRVLHSWAFDLKDTGQQKAFPSASPFWESVRLMDNGDLLALYFNGPIIRIDKDSRLLWSHAAQTHHDIDIDEAGRIYTLTNERIKLKDNVHIIDNSILILSQNGKEIGKLSLFMLMHRSDKPQAQELLKRVLGMALIGNEDVFHTNTLQILDGTLADEDPAVFRKGNILISMLTLSTIAIIDPRQEQIVWTAGPPLWAEGQHHTTLLGNGRMLTFDNHFNGRKDQSRILEFDPLTQQVIWEYRDTGFYSDTQGSQQRLANGNTLIVESNSGRAFEVTIDGKIVWQFLNPHKTGEHNELIASIYVLQRIDPRNTSFWLKTGSP